MKKLCLNCFCMLLVAVLFGCGGGGGGGGGSGGLTTTIFTDWSSVDPPENVAATGISQDTEFTVDPDGPAFIITDNGVSKDSIARIRYRTNGTIERIDVVTPYVDLSWNEATGDRITDGDGNPWVIAEDATILEAAVLFNPLGMPAGEAWEYQTFGAWATDRGVGTGAVGAISVGTPTPGDAIPAPLLDEGVVTFTGHSAGIYTSGDGQSIYRSMSDVSVAVNFFEQELLFNTTGTTLTDLETGEEWIDSPPSLEVTGLLNYIAGENAFTGNVTANGATGGMTGQSTGQFYGPAAEELGGVFSLFGTTSPESYTGSYGAAAEPSVP